MHGCQLETVGRPQGAIARDHLQLDRAAEILRGYSEKRSRARIKAQPRRQSIAISQRSSIKERVVFGICKGLGRNLKCPCLANNRSLIVQSLLHDRGAVRHQLISVERRKWGSRYD